MALGLRLLFHPDRNGVRSQSNLPSAGNGASPGTFPNFYTGTNIFWNNNATGNPVALLLQDASGNVVDFICAFDAVPSQITQPISIPSTAWVGAPIAANLDMTKTFQRTGTADHNNNTDWTVGAGTLGIQNPGLTTPFPGPQSPVTISPTISGTFAGGMWTGNITVPQPATQMRLHADDGAGHTGESTPFDAVGTMILGVTPADGLSASGQPEVLRTVQRELYSLKSRQYLHALDRK